MCVCVGGGAIGFLHDRIEISFLFFKKQTPISSSRTSLDVGGEKGKAGKWLQHNY